MAGCSKEETDSIVKLRDVATFPMWEKEMKILFMAKKVHKIVNGKEQKPAETQAQKLEEWEAKDALAQYFILRTIETTVKSHILSCENSSDMFNVLCSVYKKDTEQQKSQLLSDFFGFKFNKSLDMITNIAALQNLAFRLNGLDSKIDDTMLMTRIILALPEEYKHFSSAWDSTSKEEKKIENLKSRLIVEEEKMKGKNEETKVAFKANTNKNNKNKGQNNNKGDKKNVKCYRCQGIGHYANDCKKQDQETAKCSVCGNMHGGECYFKNGKSLPPCKYCKKNNHPSERCRYKNGNEERRNKTAYFAETHVSENENDNLDTNFVIDSGSTAHLSHEKGILTDVEEVENQQINVAKKGQTLRGNLAGNVESDSVVLKNVTYIPDLTRNLLSVNKVTSKGAIVIFDDKSVKVIQDGKVEIVEGYLTLEGKKTTSGLYIADMKENINTKQEALVTEQKATEWHKKMGHINFKDLKKLPDFCVGTPDCISKCDASIFCESCVIAKQTRRPFNTVRTRAKRPLQIIHTDVCGKVDPPTHNKEEYVLTCLDDFTHFLKVYLLRNKNEVEGYIREYVNEGEAHFNIKVEMIRCDKGGEYMSNSFKEWCKNKGIVLDYTITDTPELNGKAERINLTIFNKVRAMLHDSQLSNRMWGYAAETAVYLINRSPTASVSVTPAEMWYDKKPDLSRLRIFGSVVYTKNLGYLKKLQPRGQKGIFVGYSNVGYRIWNPQTRKIYVSRDVTFTEFFESEDGEEESAKTQIKIMDLCFDQEQEEHEINQDDDQEVISNEEEERQSEDEDQEISSEEEEGQEISKQRSRRQVKVPKRYEDFVLMVESSCVTYEDCMQSNEKHLWEKAIQEEKDCLAKNKTWVLVNESEAKGKELITSRWVFRVKEEGKYRARLVARGCQQKQDKLDFQDIFSTVVQSTSLRILLAIAASEKLDIMTFDVKSAFLYGDLQEEIYMRLPQGYNHPGKVCKLVKALYGLKQAPHQWNNKLTDFMNQYGLVQLKTDQCVFMSKDQRKKFYIAFHVDDGIICSQDKKEMKLFIEKIKNHFEVTINEKPTTYLGIQIEQRQEGIFISQDRYVKRVIETFDMQDAKPTSTPISHQDGSQEYKNPKGIFLYQEAVGSLLYLSCKTRPDVSFAVSYESRFIKNPQQKDIVNIKRTMRYLKGTSSLGILYSNNPKKPNVLEVFCDSDFAGDTKDRKSTTGYVIKFADGPIAWCSQKQKLVALSVTEAEYVSAAQCCREMKHVKNVIEELLGKKIEVALNIDNQSCIKMMKSGQLTRKSVYIDVKYHFIRDEMKQRWFNVDYCPTEENQADLFTKPLQPKQFEFLSLMLIAK